jgi:hypothetical protein
VDAECAAGGAILMALRLSIAQASKLGVKATRRPRASKPKVPVPLERDVQRSICAMIVAEFRAIPNHVPTQVMARGKIKNAHAFRMARRKDGVVDGWPDLQVRWSPASMCFLEVKRPGEVAEGHQLAVHAALRADGFAVAVVHNDEEARAALIAAGVPTRGQRLASGAVLLNRGAAP